MQIPVNQVFPNPDQPRTNFAQAEIEALAQSIKYNGLIQPITVEDTGEGYLLVDGERRWRTHRFLGMEMIEASIRPMSNHNGKDRLIHALVANIQREDMGPVDEARAFKKLLDEMGSATAVSEVVGLSVSSVSNRLVLLEFAEPIQALYNTGKLPFDTPSIRALARLPERERERVAMTAATRGVSGQILKKMVAAAEKNMGKEAPAPRPMRVRENLHTGPFDALALVTGKVSDSIAGHARETCKSCPLYSMASVTTCRECPMVAFLRRISA